MSRDDYQQLQQERFFSLSGFKKPKNKKQKNTLAAACSPRKHPDAPDDQRPWKASRRAPGRST